jgi:hypothetical protein
MTALERLLAAVNDLRPDQVELLAELAERMTIEDDPHASLITLLTSLEPDTLGVLLHMAKTMPGQVEQIVDPNSDVVTPEFARYVASRLRIHHSTERNKLTKTIFESLFISASTAAGRDAKEVANRTNPGEDILVNGIPISLKTEAAAGINQDRMTISKFMEAAWMRSCASVEDLARETVQRMTRHLSHYTRIFVLRAFDVPDSKIRYDLIEIPHTLLSRVSELQATDFTKRTRTGGSRATMYTPSAQRTLVELPRGRGAGGDVAFTVVLDGSDEKITIANLRTDLCKWHGSWTVTVQ